MIDAPVKAIAPWFGGKRTLASEIVAEFGQHAKYDEPFCGSMAVLFAKEPATHETVNDLHGDLINLARVLQEEGTAVELYGRLNRVLLHEEIFREAAGRCRDRGVASSSESPDVDRAYDYMVCAWFGRNGVAGTSSYNQGFCVRYTKNGGHAATRWTSAVASIPAWHERLRCVTILNRNSFELIPRLQDERGCVIYCDPPYIVKGAKYVHDFANEAHADLARMLRRFQKTRVVVSYYDHPDLAGLYEGWTLRRLAATKAMVNQGMRDKSGATEAPEVLLINGPSLVSQPTGGLFS